MLSKHASYLQRSTYISLIIHSLLRKCMFIFSFGALSSDHLTEKEIVSEAQGRHLFRYVLPRIGEVPFIDSVFLFECVLWDEGCVAFDIIHIYL